jgi:hypothetical protein
LAIPDGADREFFLGHLAGEAANVPALDDETRRGCLIWCNASLGEHFLGGDQTAHDFFWLRSFNAHRDRHHLSPLQSGSIERLSAECENYLVNAGYTSI